MQQIIKREVKFKFIFMNEKGLVKISSAYTIEQILEKTEDDIYCDLVDCHCQPVGETNVVECGCDAEFHDYALVDRIQYIGSADVKGNDIYENFVVDAPYTDKGHGTNIKTDIKKAKVVCCKDEFILERLTPGDKFRFIPGFDECLIVGNIYEAPYYGK